MDNYQRFQLEKYGNILPDTNNTPDRELFENGIEELNRLSEWIDRKAEDQLNEKE